MKWALIAWDKICQSKIVGGLELRDPEIISSVLGAKTWWQWLHKKDELWGNIWRRKYSPNTDPHEHKGSIEIMGT